MIRLQIAGKWVDIDDFDFELKWKHPITTSLKGESTSYSTDITVPLTELNKEIFGYKIFLASEKTNRYLYGHLYVNSIRMRVRCYIKEFSSTGIKFFLEEFKTGVIENMLTDKTTLDNIYLSQIQAGTKRDVLLNLQNGARFAYPYGDNLTLPNIFTVTTLNGRQNIHASGLLAHMAAYYGITLNNAPSTYFVFANQFKVRSNTANRNIATTLGYNGNSATDLMNGNVLLNSTVKNNIYFDNKIKSNAPFYLDGSISPTLSDGTSSTFGVNMQVVLFRDGVQIWSKLISFAANSPAQAKRVGQSPLFEAGEYDLKINILAYDEFTPVNYAANILWNLFLFADYTALEQATPNFNGYAEFNETPPLNNVGIFPCWQNLPKITFKSLLETIAIANGKMIEYQGNSINFINFEDVFSWENAIDVSLKLRSWKTKKFKFLASNNATVNYADGRVIATAIVNDETLPTTPNSVATIDAIRIEDDKGVARIKDKLVLSEISDSHFEVIDLLPILYAPLTSPKIFEAEFEYFEGNKKPLLVRQLGGIFISLESITTTKNTINLTLLKIR